MVSNSQDTTHPGTGEATGADVTRATTDPTGIPTAAQVIEALAQLRMAAPRGWSGVIGRLNRDVQWVHGLRLAYDQLGTPGPALSPAVAEAWHHASSNLWDNWWVAVQRLAARAQVAINALAELPPAKPASDFHLLPGERAVPVSRDQAPDVVPEPDASCEDWGEHRYFPTTFNHLPLQAMRIGWARLCHAAQASRDRYELGAREDDDTGRVDDVVPEHMIEQAQRLEDDANTAPDALADYAFGVAHALATDLRPWVLATGD